jgi:hypothetical protein
MTQLLNNPDAISNYFDRLLSGLGKRGSSFMNVDAVSHDLDTHRFLFQEFKQPGEALHPAQRMVLRELAGLPRCTVWFVRRAGMGRIGWAQFGSNRLELLITEKEYQRIYQAWWDNVPTIACGIEALTPTDDGRMVSAAEIPW